MENNLNLTMNIQGEMSETLKMLMSWMKTQSEYLAKNINDLKTYLLHQEKSENNTS